MRFFILALLVFVVGCEPVQFDGKVTVEKRNGATTQVRVQIPGSGAEHTFQEKRNIETFIKSLEIFIADLKSASDQMEVNEPVRKTP